MNEEIRIIYHENGEPHLIEIRRKHYKIQYKQTSKINPLVKYYELTDEY